VIYASLSVLPRAGSLLIDLLIVSQLEHQYDAGDTPNRVLYPV